MWKGLSNLVRFIYSSTKISGKYNTGKIREDSHLKPRLLLELSGERSGRGC